MPLCVNVYSYCDVCHTSYICNKKIHIQHANVAVSDKTTPHQSFTVHSTNGIDQQALYLCRIRLVLHFTGNFHSRVVAQRRQIFHELLPQGLTHSWMKKVSAHYSLNSIAVLHVCKQAQYSVLQTVPQTAGNCFYVVIVYSLSFHAMPR